MTAHGLSQDDLDRIRYGDDGLIPAIVQDQESGDVLMMAWMNSDALALTVSERRTVFWSRSRGEIWRKGGTSGNRQDVVSLDLDCDGDTLLVRVDQVGAGACHSGSWSCFDESD